MAEKTRSSTPTPGSKAPTRSTRSPRRATRADLERENADLRTRLARAEGEIAGLRTVVESMQRIIAMPAPTLPTPAVPMPTYVPGQMLPQMPVPCLHDFPTHQVGAAACRKCGLVVQPMVPMLGVTTCGGALDSVVFAALSDEEHRRMTEAANMPDLGVVHVADGKHPMIPPSVLGLRFAGSGSS